MNGPADSLGQRYGTPSRTGRLFVIVVGGLIVIALAWWLVWAIRGSSDPAVQSNGDWAKGHTAHRAWVEYTIQYGDGPVDATCSARALTADGEEVGRISFHPPRTTDPNTRHKVTFRTTREADSVEWLGCTAPGQPRPR